MSEINKVRLLWVLEDITKLAGEPEIATECGGDFDKNKCDVETCKHYIKCAQQRIKYYKTKEIIKKIYDL